MARRPHSRLAVQAQPKPLRLVIATASLVCLAMLAFQVAAHAAGMSQRTVSAFNLTTLEGDPLPLSRHDGKVILLVNTASKCGFTNQFSGLQELYERFADRGLVVIGVPSNDFNQELGEAEDIRKVCSGSYGVTFPMTEKAIVKGSGATPLYRWLRDELGSENAPRWNFHKYLIGRDGRPHKAFASHVRPTSGEVVAEIERLLAQPGA